MTYALEHEKDLPDRSHRRFEWLNAALGERVRGRKRHWGAQREVHRGEVGLHGDSFARRLRGRRGRRLRMGRSRQPARLGARHYSPECVEVVFSEV